SSFVLNDKMRVYQGHDYERVMLLTYMALNHLARGDYNSARVAIRQTHEFEAQVAELRAKQYAQVEEEARQRGARTSVRELNGYPVETIDNPAVNALRNSYQSALSHYLADSSTRHSASPASRRRATGWRTSCSPTTRCWKRACAGWTRVL